MKKLLFLILLIPHISSSQTDRDSLELDFDNSIKAVNSSNYETLLKYFPDFVFENISKEELLNDISSGGIKSNVPEKNQIKIDTIITIDSVKYARFYIEPNVSTYGIKTKQNKNWTFIDFNEQTKKYIPIEIITNNNDN